jgi:hypothetical protein
MGKLLALVLVLLAVAAIGGLLYRPGAVIGVSGKSLAHSLLAEADSGETAHCEEGEEDDHFTCTVVGPQRKVEATYVVGTKDAGCWEAVRKEGEGGSPPPTLSGCLTIVDLVRTD